MKDKELENILKQLEKLKQKQKETQEEINTLERTVQNQQNKKTNQPTQDKGFKDTKYMEKRIDVLESDIPG